MKKQFFSKYRIFQIFIILVAASIRLPLLGIIPPGTDAIFLPRLLTSITSIVSIFLFIELIKKLTQSHKLGLINGLVLTLMPWHIEQSRIHSEIMIGLTLLLGGTLLFQYFKGKYVRLAIFFITLFLFLYTVPSLWIFLEVKNVPSFSYFISNIFKLISFEYLFFHNDSFWSGGLRSFGIFLPTTIGLFTVGLLWVIRHISLKHLNLLIGFILITLVAAAHPLFPEQREYFLATPYLAFVMSIGVYECIKWFNKTRTILKIIALLYVGIMLYDVIVFAHFYTSHYSLRIEQEIPYENRNF